ncbi:peptidase M18, aminopeptidase I [Metschnikowia bicuspidata var. bicuspidata NRRL YB-4993]|uniref:Peptidase M18, aminopeptidase I n=1 Tax=Metschnikowia bicuspidata var. bicuspidata NRRL YB-4993 TaxID=869754 RepID=A0A1A0H7L9_9ASCO|nr:peptidase M18, aminopeptidase I [Metschnikowia bicuspidata var. bicuspidata NRRL YB-4993]OBA20021.1 peptidase M18, aminopeptidase I [Metschnikowia bicuspidata var. bicuspidata NRRL YB-4993]
MSRYEELLKALNDVLQESNEAGSPELREQLIAKISKPRRSNSAYDDEYFNSHAAEYIEFTYENPTIYHVVDHFSSKLKRAGFTYLPEKKSWSKLEPGKYFTYRSGSSLAAFVVGSDWTPEKGVGAIGSHIDALTVSLKPSSNKSQTEGYDLLGVAAYAGTLEPVWWDRDLGIGGRLLVKDRKTGRIEQKLVDSTPHPIAKIPSLAPHFGAPAVGPFNKETQAVPVIGFSGTEKEIEPTEAEKSAPLYGRHPLKLLRYIASSAGVAVEDIMQWDLQLFDTQKGVRGGLDKEFVFAPRVDDRVCSYAAISALIESVETGTIASDAFSLVALFDNEEIGSATRQGAKGQLIESVVSRVMASEYYSPDASDISEKLKVVYANTIVLSADVNHLVNPNFSNVYLEHHKPIPNKGMTISLDPNGHMATDSVGLALVEELAKKNGDELQYFQIRNDSRSGGTIGPSISLQTGARTIDLGIPQLSMHSIRATLGAKDIGLGAKFFAGFFANWRKSYDNYSDL